jgi:hypothetical protein
MTSRIPVCMLTEPRATGAGRLDGCRSGRLATSRRRARQAAVSAAAGAAAVVVALAWLGGAM